MIEAHTVDAWTRTADRASLAFRDAIIAGGFAAPLFLWLAGVAMALSGEAAARHAHNRAAAVTVLCRRGLEIFILAFLFRLQAFVLSPGSHAIALFRVDILNVMGPAMVGAALVWGLSDSAWLVATACAGAATAIAMLTPIVREASAIDALPIWVQWYIRPAGEHTTFTLFPWTAFVFAGVAAGVLLDRASEPERERRLQIAFASAGILLVALGFYTATLPPLYRTSSFWTSSPTYFAIRLGVMTSGLSVLYVGQRLADWWPALVKPLERLGRNSLLIYWIHVELVYGYATWPIHRRLPLWGTFVAMGALSLLMYAVVVWKDRGMTQWRRGRGVTETHEVGRMTNSTSIQHSI
jgi:uncharacterized membrane protein